MYNIKINTKQTSLIHHQFKSEKNERETPSHIIFARKISLSVYTFNRVFLLKNYALVVDRFVVQY